MRYYFLIRLTYFLFLSLLFLMPPVWQLSNNNKKPHSHVKIHSVSLYALNAILAAEDARFYHHKGIDLMEIWESFRLNLNQKKIVRGASTITQQVVRKEFLNQKKNYLRKTKEILGALLLEQILTKDEILEWYINTVHFGKGIEGIHKASLAYFQKTEDLLTLNESIHLALTLPGPSVRGEFIKNKKIPQVWHKKFHNIALKMLQNNYINKNEFIQAMATGNFGDPIHATKTEPFKDLSN